MPKDDLLPFMADMALWLRREWTGARRPDLVHAHFWMSALATRDALLVHDSHRPDPTVAFALSRLADQPTVPTPVGVFRDVDRPTYEGEVQRQLAAAQDRDGPGDLRALVEGTNVWDVA